jgi:hypothetical protein
LFLEQAANFYDINKEDAAAATQEVEQEARAKLEAET